MRARIEIKAALKFVEFHAILNHFIGNALWRGRQVPLMRWSKRWQERLKLIWISTNLDTDLISILKSLWLYFVWVQISCRWKFKSWESIFFILKSNFWSAEAIFVRNLCPFCFCSYCKSQIMSIEWRLSTYLLICCIFSHQKTEQNQFW